MATNAIPAPTPVTIMIPWYAGVALSPPTPPTSADVYTNQIGYHSPAAAQGPVYMADPTSVDSTADIEHLNPQDFATALSAAFFASLIGGTAVPFDIVLLHSQFSFDQTMWMINLPGGGQLNAGCVAARFDEGLPIMPAPGTTDIKNVAALLSADCQQQGYNVEFTIEIAPAPAPPPVPTKPMVGPAIPGQPGSYQKGPGVAPGVPGGLYKLNNLDSGIPVNMWNGMLYTASASVGDSAPYGTKLKAVVTEVNSPWGPQFYARWVPAS